ncbi:MAG: BatD family protein [Enterobacterales bacterium]|nr:BatD family protein [Enterobacterales bacterium]
MKYYQVVNSINFSKETKFLYMILLSVILLIPSISHAQISQSIDRTDIHAGETFVLTIEIERDNGEKPDLSLIPKEFTLHSTSQYQQMTNFNGEIHTTKGWKIKLSSLKTGKLVIPPITVGNESTQSIMLFIKDTNSQISLGGNPKAIFLEAEVSKHEVYVQQQVILTIKLYRSLNTRLARLSEVIAAESIIEKLGDDEQYYQTIDNKRYLVSKIRYALFPQKSGNLTIESIGFSAEVNDPNASQNSFRYLSATRPISIRTKAINISVNPVPNQARQPWMPASSVTLKGQISQDSTQLTLGEPVTWTIKLSAQGLSESQLAELKFPKVAGLQFYPDTPQKERDINKHGIRGQRIEKIAIVPSQQGDFELPEIKVYWWDVQTDSEKSAIIPARKITVVAAPNSSVQDRPAEVITPVIKQKNTTQKLVNADYWRYGTALFALLWLATLIAWLRSRRAYIVKHQQHTSSNKNVYHELKLYPQLLKAIKDKNIATTEKHLINWANSLGSSSFHSIGQLSSSIEDPAVADKLNLLEALRYSAKLETGSLNSEKFVINQQDLKLIERLLTQSKSKKTKNEIPPLY